MTMGSIPRLSKSSPVFSLVAVLIPSIARAQFTPQPPSDAPNASDEPTGHSLAVAAITLTTVCFMLWVVSIYNRHRCVVRMDGRVPVVVVRSLGGGLDPDVVGAIPTMVYSDVKRLRLGKGGSECAVCFGEFEDHERLRLMPNCDHGFHVDCIDAWLAWHRTCPVCRADVAPGNNQTSAHPVPTASSESNCRSSIVQVVVEENRNRSTSPADLNRILEPGHVRTGSLIRSLSTGDFPIHQDEDADHFTLRLPLEVRNRATNSAASPTRASKSDRWLAALPAQALPVLSRESPQR